MGVPLKDLIDPAAAARLRAAAGMPPADDPPAETGRFEVKDAVTGELEHKADPGLGGAQVLSADDETGIVEALVSVTGIVDKVKDIIEPGAYTKTMAEREAIGVWSHDDKTWVARTEEAIELPPGDPFLAGLKTMDGKPWPKEAGAVKVKSRFNLETPHGAAAFSDVKFFEGKTGWSIGYRATKAYRNPRTGVRHIKELDWYEYSPVMVGAASQPMTLSVKSLAQPVDADDPTGFAGPDVLEALTEDEVKAYMDLRASLGLETKVLGELETKDKVRTAAGARRFGQPIGTEIIKDSVKASSLKVGDVVEKVHLQDPDGGPSDSIDVSGKIEKVRTENGAVKITVEGREYNLGRGENPIDIMRAKKDDDYDGPGRVSPVMKDALDNASPEKLDEIIGRLEQRQDDDSKATLHYAKAQRAKKGGGSDAGGGKASGSDAGDSGSKPWEGKDTVDMSDDEIIADLTKVGRLNPKDPADRKAALERIVELSNERYDRYKEGTWKRPLGNDGKATPVRVKLAGEVIVKDDNQEKNPDSAKPAAAAAPKGDDRATLEKAQAADKARLAELEKLPSAGASRGAVPDQIRDVRRRMIERDRRIDALGGKDDDTADARGARADAAKPAPAPRQSLDTMIRESNGNSPGKNQHAELREKYGVSQTEAYDVRALTGQQQWDYWRGRAGGKSHDSAISAAGGDKRAERARAQDAAADARATGKGRFMPDAAAKIAPKGTMVTLGGTEYRVRGHADVPVSKAYENEDGSKIDLKLERLNARGEVTATTSTRVDAAALKRIVEKSKAAGGGPDRGGSSSRRDKERAADAAADAKVERDKKLAALNRRRRARGLPPTLRLPGEMKALDLGDFTDDELDVMVLADPEVKYGDPELEEKRSRASLNRSPKKNWVERAGDLPGYIREVARAIHEDHGVPLDRAIPMAISRIKRWARGGGNVNADTRAKAAKAVAEWEALKAKNRAKFDSDLLAEIQTKALDELDRIEAAWQVLVDAGEVKADADGADADFEEPVLEPEEPVEDFAELLNKGAELRSEFEVKDLLDRGRELKESIGPF